MKKLLLILLLMVPIFSFAQTIAKFKLSTTGTFVSEEGKDFIVIPFEGKTAHQIFQILCTNVAKTYKNPDKVMSVVADVSVSIRGYDDKLTYIKDLIQTYDIGGYYNLHFEIKDGRVKVNAPIIDESMTKTVNGEREKDYSRMIKSWEKDGKFKEKFIKQVIYTENNINAIINTILGAFKDKEEDNW